MAGNNPFLRTTPRKPPQRPPTREEIIRATDRIRSIMTPGDRPGPINPAGMYGDAPAPINPVDKQWGRGPVITAEERAGYAGERNVASGTRAKKRSSGSGKEGGGRSSTFTTRSSSTPAFGYRTQAQREVNDYFAKDDPATGRAGDPIDDTPVVVVTDEPGTGRPRVVTVLERAQRARALPMMDDAGISDDVIRRFARNYRATHRAELSNAQLALMARYLHSQSGTRGALFREDMVR